MVHFRILICVLTVNLFSLANSEVPVNIDNTICGGPPSVIICVQRTLNEIATAAKNIHSLTIQIEQNIVSTLASSSPSNTHTNDHTASSLLQYQRDPNTHTLQNQIINELSNINTSLPASKTHQQFMIMNNIDKVRAFLFSACISVNHTFVYSERSGPSDEGTRLCCQLSLQISG